MAKIGQARAEAGVRHDGNLGEQLGLTKDWMSRIVKAVAITANPSIATSAPAQSSGLPAAQPALDQGRNPVRAADPLTKRLRR